jgi:hypothetical protein
MSGRAGTETNVTQKVREAFAGVGGGEPVDFTGVYRRAACRRRGRRVRRLLPLAAAAVLVFATLPFAGRRMEQRRLFREAVAYQTELIFESSVIGTSPAGIDWPSDLFRETTVESYHASESGDFGSWWLAPVEPSSY